MFSLTMGFDYLKGGIQSILNNGELVDKKGALDQLVEDSTRLQFSFDDLNELERTFPTEKRAFEQQIVSEEGVLKMYTYLKAAKSREDALVEFVWNRLKKGEEKSRMSFDLIQKLANKEEVTQDFSRWLDEKLQIVEKRLYPSEASLQEQANNEAN